jgi:hypothetical protein
MHVLEETFHEKTPSALTYRICPGPTQDSKKTPRLFLATNPQLTFTPSHAIPQPHTLHFLGTSQPQNTTRNMSTKVHK